MAEMVLVAVRNAVTDNWHRFYEVEGNNNAEGACRIAFRYHFKRKEIERCNELGQLTMALTTLPISKEVGMTMISHVIHTLAEPIK